MLTDTRAAAATSRIVAGVAGARLGLELGAPLEPGAPFVPPLSLDPSVLGRLLGVLARDGRSGAGSSRGCVSPSEPSGLGLFPGGSARDAPSGAAAAGGRVDADELRRRALPAAATDLLSSRWGTYRRNHLTRWPRGGRNVSTSYKSGSGSASEVVVAVLQGGAAWRYRGARRCRRGTAEGRASRLGSWRKLRDLRPGRASADSVASKIEGSDGPRTGRSKNWTVEGPDRWNSDALSGCRRRKVRSQWHWGVRCSRDRATQPSHTTSRPCDERHHCDSVGEGRCHAG